MSRATQCAFAILCGGYASGLVIGVLTGSLLLFVSLPIIGTLIALCLVSRAADR